MTVPTMAYIGREPCGCVTMATLDDPNHAKDVAKFVAKCIRDGLKVERVTSGYVREHWGSCKCKAEVSP